MFLTLNAPHGSHLGESIGSLTRLWSAAFSHGSWFGDWRARHGVTGWVRVLECTFTPDCRDGHPHLHVLVLGSDDLTEDAGTEMMTRWAEVGNRPSVAIPALAKLQHNAGLIPASDRETVVRYVLKQHGLHHSRPEDTALSVGDLVDRAANLDPDAIQLLDLYQRAVFRKRKVTVSAGFWNLDPDLA